jgi:hypothetical protein
MKAGKENNREENNINAGSGEMSKPEITERRLAVKMAA